MNETNAFFTVIIPTRNRPELFEKALLSVIQQTFQDKEIVVVNDGSDPEFLEIYRDLEKKYASNNVIFRYQINRPNGHGQSYSMNTGAYTGCGRYLAFLDDDDYWIDKNHLLNAHNSIKESPDTVDAYYTNQEAFFSDGSKQKQNVWIEDLAQRLVANNSDNYNAYKVDVAFLLESKGFAHLNCSIIRRELYLSINGMDEGIRYECDRDIYLRTLDASNIILYNPSIISKHHIPDKKKKDNMSTLINEFEKYLFQISVYEKAILLAKSADIKRHAAQSLSYIYKHIAMIFFDKKDYTYALHYAKKAFSPKASMKWWLFSQSIRIRKLLTF